MRHFTIRRRSAAGRKAAVAWAGLAAMILGLAGCAGFQTYRLESRTPAKPITVDGRDDDWRGNLYYNVEGQYSLGFVNDAQYLYACLVITDPYKRTQILMNGMTLWIDPDGGKKKELGIKFPLGLQPNEMVRPEMMPGPLDEERPSPEFPTESWTELEVFTPNNKMPLKMKVQDAQGLEVKATAPAGMLIYEVKVPLRKTTQTPWAVGAQPGRTIGLGFETGKFEGRRMPLGGRGGYPGGGRYPGGSRTSPADFGERGGAGRGIVIPEELKVWAIVKLVG